ncbi:hypothetical protein [Parachitinimonas caeni]|uniref:Uncharacterized protein n=1 Tax=Parachitinimonas caeni TaxID=3031301 RepID=A0ABT7E6S9_9NEIS|nr:hypothetical protein [Parachitinimonas caeni]MDK2127058.1 hypothetical protein [Parachitinimonas caeni]
MIRKGSQVGRSDYAKDLWPDRAASYVGEWNLVEPNKPVLSSRHLYAGRRSGSKQVASRTDPGVPLVPSFDDV